MSQAGSNNANSPPPSVATQYFADDGTFAVPDANVLNIIAFQSSIINTTADTNSVYINSGTLSFSTSNIPGEPNHAYATSSLARIDITLPAIAESGTDLCVICDSGGGWRITQNAGQFIRMDSQQTTTGVGGSLASTQVGDCVYLRCMQGNTYWRVFNSMGNITVV